LLEQSAKNELIGLGIPIGSGIISGIIFDPDRPGTLIPVAAGFVISTDFSISAISKMREAGRQLKAFAYE